MIRGSLWGIASPGAAIIDIADRLRCPKYGKHGPWS